MTQRRTDDSGTDDHAADLVALFEAHVDGVYTVAYRIVWNRADADDVAQATFLKAFLNLERLRDRDRARAWLYRIAYREAISVIRRRRDTPVDPADLPEPVDIWTPEAAVEARQLAMALDEAVGQLPVSLRAAFVLRDIEGLPMADVAATLDIGGSAAKMRVHRARAQLRTILQEVFDDLRRAG